VPFALAEWMRFGHHSRVDTGEVESSVAESAVVSRFTYWFVLPGVATWFGIQIVRAVPGADSFVMAFAALRWWPARWVGHHFRLRSPARQ